MAEQRLRENCQEAPPQALCVLFVNELGGGFDALRVCKRVRGSECAGCELMPPTSREPRVEGPGRIHGTAVAGGGHRLWGDGHRAPGTGGDVI